MPFSPSLFFHQKMIKKENSHTTLEIISKLPPLYYSPKKIERKVTIQIGGDETPKLCRKPGIDSEPFLATIQNSSILSNLPRRNHSHHSFFGLTNNSSKKYFFKKNFSSVH